MNWENLFEKTIKLLSAEAKLAEITKHKNNIDDEIFFFFQNGSLPFNKFEFMVSK